MSFFRPSYIPWHTVHCSQSCRRLWGTSLEDTCTLPVEKQRYQGEILVGVILYIDCNKNSLIDHNMTYHKGRVQVELAVGRQLALLNLVVRKLLRESGCGGWIHESRRRDAQQEIFSGSHFKMSGAPLGGSLDHEGPRGADDKEQRKDAHGADANWIELK